MRPFTPIAIVGRACLLPGASSPDELWDAVVAGRDLISQVPPDRWRMPAAAVMSDGPDDSVDRTWSDRGGYVEGFDERFDAGGFGLPASELAGLDPVFRWTLHTAREALRDAGYDGGSLDRAGAVLGNLSFPSASMARFTETVTLDALPGYGMDALAAAGIEVPDARNRFTSGLPALLLERALGLGQGAMALDAACASSLYAIKIACDRLADGDADLMLAGAVNSADDLCIHLGFAALTALSRTGRSRPFHADADGLVPAEGCGFVALRTLEAAQRDGDQIHGVIRGVGLSNDGRGRGLLVPSREGQTRAIARAFEGSGLEPADVSLLECHATGTSVGDGTEIASAAAVYGGGSTAIPIGSLKSNTGHLITAAGVAGLIKVVEAMRHETRPPTLHTEVPHGAIADSPFRLLDAPEPWDRDAAGGVLRAGVSAFGFGGNNAHLLVEEPPSQVASNTATHPSSRSGVTGDTRTPGGVLAIVGIGIRAASAVGREAFTDALLTGRSCLDADGQGRMDDVDLDVKTQKFPPNDLRRTLTQQLAMLAVTEEALADVEGQSLSAAGVYVGMGTDPEAARFGLRWRLAEMAPAWGADEAWIAAARDEVGPPLDAPGVLGTMPNIVANRLNSQHDAAGPSFTVSSEERSGLDALRVATRALDAGEIDVALVGAVDLSCEPVHQRAATTELADDRQRPGDAAVLLVVKRLDDAERDGDTVYATLPGSRRDAAGEPLADRPDATFGLTPGATNLTELFGHAHAASGLVHVAAAALSLHHRRSVGGAPLLASNPGSGTGLPDGAGPLTAQVAIDAMDGLATRTLLLAAASGHAAAPVEAAPKLHVYSGVDATEVLTNLDDERESDIGPARLVIVASDDTQRLERAERARRHLTDGHPPGVGVRFAPAPIDGELAFVFTAAGAAYPGMGSQLLASMPELLDRVGAQFPLRETAGWVFAPESAAEPSPNDFLWGTSMLTSAHVDLTRNVLELRPAAAIGYSSGESNSLYAFGVWNDRDAMRRQIDATGMMVAELGGSFDAVARAWGQAQADWAMWNLTVPVDEVRSALEDEPLVHLAIINTGSDVVIGGDATACQRIVERLGVRRARRVAYNLACHVPEVAAEFHQPWVDVHTRDVTPADGVRFYSNGVNGSYEVSTAACAKAITRQAESTLDFPATIRAAYADGVRVFVEHGPSSACTTYVRAILADRDDVVAVHLDRRDKNVEQLFDAVAALVAVGHAVNHAALTARLTPPPAAPDEPTGPMVTFAAHPPAATLPPRPDATATGPSADDRQAQRMAPAPRLASVLASASNGTAPRERPNASETTAPLPAMQVPEFRTAAPADAVPVHAAAPAVRVEDQLAATVHAHVANVARMHREFVQTQAAMHESFLHARTRAWQSLPLGQPIPTAHDPIAIAQATTSASTTAPAPPPAAMPVGDTAPAPVAPPAAPLVIPELAEPRPDVLRPIGPTWDKEQLKIHSSGRISELFGPEFAAQDVREIQCRMPEPPLLLADRVTGLDAEPRVLGQGTIWTETDVVEDAWYLNDGYMPTGFMIESGQADLMLISWMGIDLITDADRSYRLLGCTLTYHGNLPSPGETLSYEIRITGHAKHGDIRLFFFEYDCLVDGEPRLTVRDAQAGFFNQAELADALGILWSPEATIEELDPAARVDAPPVACTKAAFSADDVVAFSEGRAADCFGPGYEWTHTHTRTPKIQDRRQLFIDEITDFDVVGGPWGRGFLRCETKIEDDAWFFDGHFKNDPCMPGNFMVEACVQALSFYLAALGHTTHRDGWRFQPLPEQPFDLKCRGEINPATRDVVYEVHVEEVWDGPHPTVIADVLGFVDGRPAFHAHRIGVELVPDWPLTSKPELTRGVVEPGPVATDADGFPFDFNAMIACAWGRPSEAFGSMYAMFDGTRRSPRLPGEPYHFISRVTQIDGELDVPKAGMKIVCEYDVPEDVWYFDANGAETMPFAVLLEAALQPCGWVASAIGSVTGLDDDRLFRNLDGTGTVLEELTRTSGTLTTHVELTSVSQAGGMIIEAFEVTCLLGDRKVYEMSTVFGFFPPTAFDNQAGLPIQDTHRARLESGGRDAAMIDLTERPARFCDGSARLAEPMLLMVDRVVFTPGAGEAGLGIVRGEKDVDVTEWFFKAHFFQDPVQPGSLGVEALLQLLQVAMLAQDLDVAAVAAGMHAPRFEPIQLDAPMTWKYRGQVTPSNELISSTMEITESGVDDRGRPYVVGTGSLWCDGLRIYEVRNMGMRLVDTPLPGSTSTAADVADEPVEIPLAEAKRALRDFWTPRRATPTAWLGDDLIEGMLDRYVHSIQADPAFLASIPGRSAIYVANHQVQIESLLISNLLPAITGVTMTTVANAKHRHRWLGEMVASLEAYPGSTTVEQIAYFDQSDPGSMLDVLARVRARMAEAPHALFVHVDGTRSRSSRDTTQRCSSVFVDLALELGIPIVPVRFAGGLPVERIDGKAEVPVGHGQQDYRIGAPLLPEALAALPLKQRIAAVIDAINGLGPRNAVELPLPADAVFAASVREREEAAGVSDVYAASWRILESAADPSNETAALLAAGASGTFVSDGTASDDWLAGIAPLFLGGGTAPDVQAPAIRVHRDTCPALVDHVVHGAVVIPAALCVDWMARAAAAAFPELSVTSVADVRVRKGIVADGFLDGHELLLFGVLEVVSEEPSEAEVVVRLSDVDGRARYVATVRLASPTTDRDEPVTGPDVAPADVYGEDSVLFHGPAFQVLGGVSIGAGSLTASLSGVVDRGWAEDDWVIDPALLDGVLQLALLWTDHLVPGPSLPTAIGEVEITTRPMAGALQATLTQVAATRSKVTCDVELRDATGTSVGWVRGIDTHRLPSS